MKKIIAIGMIILFVGLFFQPAFANNSNYFSINYGELAWWEFNEGSGTTAGDSSGHGYNGNVVGATWTVEGLSFDGIDDYVEFDAHAQEIGINKTDDFTFIVRFRSDGGCGMLYSMSHTNTDRAYFDLMLDEEGKVGVILGDITCTYDLFTTGTYNDGDWHVIESEFFGDRVNPTLNLYVDGELEATKTEWLSPMIDEDFQTVKVGRNSNSETDYLDGEIDDIKIYKNQDYTPPPPPRIDITGPDSGKSGQKLTYIFQIIGPWEYYDWMCFIDWGDGNYEWAFPDWPDDNSVSVSHVWNDKGNYIIRAYAEWGGLCGPTATKHVIIPRDKQEDFDCLTPFGDVDLDRLNEELAPICYYIFIRLGILIVRIGTLFEIRDTLNHNGILYKIIESRLQYLEQIWNMLYELNVEYDCGLPEFPE